MKKNGFTLMELLVVLAIIATLAALLFPTLSAIRDRSKQAICQNNLKQLGVALGLYIHDFDDIIPRADYNVAPQLVGAWQNLLYPSYISSKDLFLCPTNPVGWDDYRDYWDPIIGPPLRTYPIKYKWVDRFPTSYGMNEFISYNVVTINNPNIELSDLKEPANTIALGESRLSYFTSAKFWGLVIGDGPKSSDRGGVHHHHKRINYVFLDGHGRGLTALQTLQPQSLWGSKNVVEKLAENHPSYYFRLPIDPIGPDHYLVKSIVQEYR